MPACVRKTTCPSDLLSLVGTYEYPRMPWRTYLSDSCSLLDSHLSTTDIQPSPLEE
jgi:hypothetical protein